MNSCNKEEFKETDKAKDDSEEHECQIIEVIEGEKVLDVRPKKEVSKR